MRVALVVERFDATGGGVEQLVWGVARGLVEAGDEVHVIARRASDAPGVRFHRANAPSFWQPIRVTAFSRSAGRHAREGDFDVVHSFSRTLHQDVFHAGGGSHADYMRRAYGPVGAALRRASPRHATLLALERRILAEDGPLIECVSRMVRDELERRYAVDPKRLEVIHCGVDTERFHPQRHRAARAALREELDATGCVWLLAGSGWPRKGLDTALHALARCDAAPAQLWVAGRGDARPWQRLAERLGIGARTRFLGERCDMERIYAAADGLLFPTRYDGFGLAVLEAAAAGLAIVTSSACGAAELFADAGRVVADPDDVDAFAAALGELAAPELRAELGDAARRVAEAHDRHSHVARLRQLYARIAR